MAACVLEGRFFADMPTLSIPKGQRPAPKSYYAGTHRLISPEQTFERMRRLTSVMGITRIGNVTGLDTIGVPVVMVCRPNSRSIAVAQGKGLTLAAAKASGLMEAMEGYHAERITLPLKLASYEELRYTHNVVDPSLLPQMSSGLFHRNLPLFWIEGHDMLQAGRLSIRTRWCTSTTPFLSLPGAAASSPAPMAWLQETICSKPSVTASARWWNAMPQRCGA